jgi:class 3 adenylate cyclase/predicted ATPase
MNAARQSVQIGSISGERRQVTALFYDVVGSTELLHRLDPEDYAGMQRLLHQDAIAVIKRYNGYLDQIQGDGGCAFFGLPEPFEDAAESGVGCALEMIEGCSKEGRPYVPYLRLRIGVATGRVVVADTKDSNLPGHTQVIGITPALAARIQLEARPNSVAVADSTYRLTRGAFVFEPMGERRLKGFSELINLWRPTARQSHADRFSAQRRVTAPLIGREKEMDLCRQRWRNVVAGKGQIVALQGEAGMGKSRIAAELRRDLVEADAMPLIFQCQPRGNRRPLHPFLDRLQQVIVAHDASVSEFSADTIRHYFEARGLTLSKPDSDLLAFLLESTADAGSGSQWPSGASVEQIRGRALNVVLDLIIDWCRHRSQLVVIEDVHWADTLTQAAIARLRERIVNLPIFAIVTSRENLAPELLRHDNVCSIRLGRLSESAVTRLLDSIWQGSPPENLAAFVHTKSDGVPLFAEELSHLLKERMAEKSGPKDWEALLREGNIVSLQDLAAARLASLGPIRRVAQIASVIGREFELDLLSQVIESETLPVSLDTAINQLANAGIIQPGIEPNLRFRHVLIQEAAYDNLLKADRRELHTRIVRLALSGTVTRLPDEVLAWHCSEAALPIEGTRYAIQAAESCLVRSAVPEAAQLLDFAEEQLSKAQAESGDIDGLRLRLLTVRGPVSAALYGRGSERTRSVYEQGVALSASRSDEDRSQWFPLYWGWWFTAPDYATQRQRSDILLQDLEGVADPEVRLQSLHCAWATNIHAGAHRRCLHCVEKGLRLYDEERALRSRVRYGHDAKVCGLGERAFSHWFMGDERASEKSLAEMMDWAQHIGHLESMVHALDYAVGLMHYRKDHEGVIGMADRLSALGDKHSLPGANAKAALFRGWARTLKGERARGPIEFEEGYTMQRKIGTEENVSMHGGMQAEILECLGRHDEALLVLDAAIDRACQSGQVFWLAELHRTRARLRQAVGRSQEEVRADLDRALAIAIEQEAGNLAARARADIERHMSGGGSSQ